MKHIKRGRGPSMMDGVVYIAVAAFGVIWTLGALSMGAGLLFAMFGVVFVGIAVVNGLYALNNATRKNRFSEIDIVDSEEEPDPLQARFSRAEEAFDASPETRAEGGFCPYCGEKAGEDFAFCAKCGRRLPE